ncbi:methylated-DNA--[protein]-cysteine S-methyltransferase [Engelhardtia mirabilis]|uniref:methylated-DNA--[protein]-cysteine S-methyltransferase n=1 Tax=Engelhardtia mirabilis TaxID=2528011 RepID=A0A518BR32_9BACT|nr:Bifunctional transcriptional activator/DNA repair enzyme Ada [Planctomycetes bacterium Pla133]QDV03754.1 Bifunctional transcriptional activator/DNA repair enzyme Ada [Planctomycetes bacterium Pla86]
MKIAMADTGTSVDRLATAIERIVAARGEPLDLDRLALDLGLSRARLDRVFREHVGLSPARLAQLVTLERARGALAGGEGVLGAALGSGLSGPGRLHDLFVTVEGVTPGEWKRRAGGVHVTFGVAPTPFGACLLARTERGICALFFGDAGEMRADLAARFPEAELVEDHAAVADDLAAIFDPRPARRRPFHLDLRGTNLQLKVWEALLAIPTGAVTSYTEVARLAGRPDATRAVASAIGRNPVSWLIPCHRVLRRTGELGGYRWGLERKRAMLAVEAGRSEPGK